MNVHRKMRWTVAFVLYFPNFGFALQCLYCTGVVKPADCDTVMECGSHEQCYLDAFVSASGSIRYNLGCRDLLICAGSAHISGQNISRRYQERQLQLHRAFNISDQTLISRSSGLLVCSECCSGDLCSSSGCGNAGYMLPRGPICYNCPYQQTPDDCSTITMCGQDEVCMLLKTVNRMTKEVRYSSKCEHEKACDDKLQQLREVSALLVGKRRTGSLTVGGSCIVKCCIHDLCNRDCYSNSSMTSSPSATTTTPLSTTAVSKQHIVYSTLPHVVTTTATPDPCFSNPCMGGTCSIYKTTYRCTCRDGYWGRNCELVYKTFPALTTLKTTTSPTTRSSIIRATSTTDRITTPKMNLTKYPWNTCCPDGWFAYKGSCYNFYDEDKIDWNEAVAFCRRRNSELVTIDTENENRFIQNIVRTMYPPNSPDSHRTAFWTGANDLDIEGLWKWVATDERLTYTEWDTNACHGKISPDTDPFNNEDCVALNGAYDFCWSDGVCKERVGYPLCEMNNHGMIIIG